MHTLPLLNIRLENYCVRFSETVELTAKKAYRKHSVMHYGINYKQPSKQRKMKYSCGIPYYAIVILQNHD